MNKLETAIGFMKEKLSIHLFELGGTEVTPKSIIAFFVILTITWSISKLFGRMLVRFFARTTSAKEGSILALRRLFHYSLMFVGLGIALQTIGVQMQALFAAGAVFAVAIGFAMQNIAQNFVSGVIMLVERSIQPEDILEVEGQLVRIKQMGIRATIARTRDEEDIIIPNSTLVQSSVRNYTMRDSVYRLGTIVGVAYDSDMQKVSDVLLEVANEIPWRLQGHEPVILLEEFGSSSVNFRANVWIGNPWKRRKRISDFNKRIWRALKNANITIAFPQMDIHFDGPINEGVGGLKKVV